MTDRDKIELMDYIIRRMEESDTSADMTVLVGKLNKAQGLNGFKKADIGHPVFEFKDRYVIYLESEKELTEKVYDHQRQQFNTKIGFFMVAVPYYKETLSKVIDFISPRNAVDNS